MHIATNTTVMRMTESETVGTLRAAVSLARRKV